MEPRSGPAAIVLFQFVDFACIPCQLESPMQQCHQKVKPVGVVYATKATMEQGRLVPFSRPVLTEAALDGFSSVPVPSLKLLAQDRSNKHIYIYAFT